MIAILSGLHARARWAASLAVNPKGIGAFSPGLARFREGLPWVTIFQFHNPEKVASQRLAKGIQPFQGCHLSVFSPRVARSSQPWADRFNPFGIAEANPPILTCV